jgi:hypothetical protein
MLLYREFINLLILLKYFLIKFTNVENKFLSLHIIEYLNQLDKHQISFNLL